MAQACGSKCFDGPLPQPHGCEQSLADSCHPVARRERVHMPGSPSSFRSAHAIDRTMVVASTSQTELNLPNQQVGVSGAALVNRFIVRITDCRESHRRESGRHGSRRW